MAPAAGDAGPGSVRPDSSVPGPLFPEPPEGFRWREFGPGGALVALVAEGFPARHAFTCRFRDRRSAASPLGAREEAERDLNFLERAVGVRVLHPMRQVHGDQAVVAAGDQREASPPEADALLTRTPGAGVAVKAADCVPVLLADPVSGAVAGVHAGWRGTLARVAEQAARALAVLVGAPPARLAAVIGPAIRACCFEVGPEVRTRFAEGGHDVARIAVARPGSRRPHLDLPLANRLQLVAAGLPEEAVRDSGLCTRCHPAFHSYRREGPGVGRNWSVAACRSAGLQSGIAR